MKYSYKTKNTCSTIIDFEIDDNNIVTGVQFQGGCNGNLKAIAKLVEGQNADKVIGILKGIKCGLKSTSCADQLATALQEKIHKRNAGDINNK